VVVVVPRTPVVVVVDCAPVVVPRTPVVVVVVTLRGPVVVVKESPVVVRCNPVVELEEEEELLEEEEDEELVAVEVDAHLLLQTGLLHPSVSVPPHVTLFNEQVLNGLHGATALHWLAGNGFSPP